MVKLANTSRAVTESSVTVQSAKSARTRSRPRVAIAIDHVELVAEVSWKDALSPEFFGGGVSARIKCVSHSMATVVFEATSWHKSVDGRPMTEHAREIEMSIDVQELEPLSLAFSAAVRDAQRRGVLAVANNDECFATTTH